MQQNCPLNLSLLVNGEVPLPFMAPEGSLRYKQQPTTGPWSLPTAPSPFNPFQYGPATYFQWLTKKRER